MPTILNPGFFLGEGEGEGERGERGKRGHRGHRGHDGHDGAPGPTGPAGTATLTGATGPTGPTGSIGPTGPGSEGGEGPFQIMPASWWLAEPTELIMDEGGGAVFSGINTGTKAAIADLSQVLDVGDPIVSLTLRWRNGATPTAGSITFTVQRVPTTAPTTAVTLAAVTVDTNTGGALANRSQVLLVGAAVLVDNGYSVLIEMDATAGDDQAGLSLLSVNLA